ncbi:MAG: flippase [Ignavibacteria bacterium]|nr:flippase [Ignavibacteria bacterium]MBI3766663.1 flippase [Ignavibacteriales bacterium]
MKRVSRNFLSIIGSDIMRRILGFFTVAYLARKVGTAGFGAINIGFTIFSYALVISSAGLGSFGTRAVARGDNEGIISSVISLRLVSGIFAFLITAAVAIFCIPNATTSVLAILFCAGLIGNAFLLDWYFQGKEEMGKIGIGRLLSAAVYLLLVIAVVHSAENILWVALASVVGDLVAAFALIQIARTQGKGICIRFTLKGWKSLLQQAFPIGIGGMIAHISVNFPLIAIGIILTNSDVGVYSAANKLVVFLLMFDRVMATLLLPASSRLHAQSFELLSSTLSDALRWIVIIALPICIGGLVLADRLVPLVFGAQYLNAVVVLRILIWFFFFTMLHTVYTSGLIAIGQEKIYGRLMVISGVMYGGLVTVGTLSFGVWGAALAVVIAEAGTLLLMRQHARRLIVIHVPPKIMNATFSGIFMGVVIAFLPPFPLFLTILFGAIVYLVLLVTTRAIIADDFLNILKRV